MLIKKRRFSIWNGINLKKGEKIVMAKVGVGSKVQVLCMEGEPQYTGKIGVVESIDAIGQLHGTWGGCAIIPGTDEYSVLD